ncbi:MAG: hypothetical protein H6727_10415 [Myxococcales bacterium]|nr:hypothetical protein [Myxococcales bacterium]
MKPRYLLGLLSLSLLAGTGFFISCQEGTGTGSRAWKVTQRDALIGGPMAAGNLGDFLLENGKIRTIISRPGISEAFGFFGGNLTDADRVRAGTGQGSNAGGRGFDTLVEFFPLFFLSVVDTQEGEIVNDGRDGQPAKVRIKGQGASFIALTEQLNNLITFMGGKNRLGFTMEYTLEPGKNYVRLDTTISNEQDQGYSFETFGGIVPAVNGVVGLFGKRNTLFIPGLAGYNIRFTLEEIFKKKLSAPAIPGLIGDFVGSKGQGGVNYGIVAAREEDNYVYTNRKEFEKLNDPGKPAVPIDQGSVIVPLEGSSITGCFTRSAPSLLAAKGSAKSRFTYTVFLVIGDGSVSSIRDAQIEIHQKPFGYATGQLFEEGTLRPLEGARVMAYKGEGAAIGDRVFYTEFNTDAQGRFFGKMEPGEYNLIARFHNVLSKPFKVTIAQDQRAFTQMTIPQAAIVGFTIRDAQGRLLPAKASALGLVRDFEAGRCVGKSPLGCLYDPHLDAPEIATDFKAGRTCADGATCLGNVDCRGTGDELCMYRLKPETEYREDFAVTPNGQGILRLRPGKYKIVASRGIEYELATQEVEVKAGEVKQVELVLLHSVPTPKMVSGDFHVHTNYSHDVSMSDRDRVTSYAAEGVDLMITTDHNRIRDLRPLSLTLGLEQWMNVFTGLELTTFEMGHFNAFPLKIDVSSFNGGAPPWFKKDDRYKEDEAFPASGSKRPLQGFRLGIPPGELFASMRRQSLLGEDKVIVQVNHPRDSIFGYFNTYGLSADTARPVYTSGLSSPLSREFDIDKYSEDFDALEIFNSKELGLIWSWRLPPGIQPPTGYGGVENSVIRKDEGGKALVAYPGGGDDWFNLLNRGKVYTATANSDSHGFTMEAGSPRNYLLSGTDHPQQLGAEKLVELIRAHKVLLTNGPILEFSISDSPDGTGVQMGETLALQGKDKAYLKIVAKAPSWIDISEVVIYQNGRVIRKIPVPSSQQPERLNTQIEVTVDADAWFVVAAKGLRSDLWPVVTPTEFEPFQIGQAVSLLQETLLASFPVSLNLSSDTCLVPTRSRLVTPYALTNPIWIDRDGDGKYTPDPCKTLGESGILCRANNTQCVEGACVGQKTCTEDKNCEVGQSCLGGKCSVDSCAGLTCSPAFETCDDTKACADDTCAAQDRTCKDGKSCRIDADCAGIGDGFCRYCRCPAPRKACKDGTPCSKDEDCSSGACTDQRLCKPTACAMGRCLPTYPVCKADQLRTDAYLYLKTKEGDAPKNYSRLSLDQMRADYRRIPAKELETKDDRYQIKQVGAFFLFFEHRH